MQKITYNVDTNEMRLKENENHTRSNFNTREINTREVNQFFGHSS